MSAMAAGVAAAKTGPLEAFQITTGRDDRGGDVFGFLVKRAYRLTDDGLCERCETAPFRPTDDYRGDPQKTGPLHEGEIVAYKPATDVVVLGRVYAPGGLAHRCTAGIEIGAARKLIAVIGDRSAFLREDSIVFSDPLPFAAIDLAFERAYGGPTYPRNPVGVGFLPMHAQWCNIALPNFEDPADLLTPSRLLPAGPKAWHLQPLPQGMAWFGKAWYPRMSYVGVIPGEVDADQEMPEEALGLVPKGQIGLGRQFRLPSWDARFCNGAAPGLAVPGLRGDETIRLLNLTPTGRASFRLPGETPAIVADIGDGESRPPVRLYSVVIEPDLARVTLIWGATLCYPGIAWLAHMKRLAGFVA